MMNSDIAQTCFTLEELEEKISAQTWHKDYDTLKSLVTAHAVRISYGCKAKIAKPQEHLFVCKLDVKCTFKVPANARHKDGGGCFKITRNVCLRHSCLQYKHAGKVVDAS